VKGLTASRNGMGIELSRHSMKEHSVGFGLYTSLVTYFPHISDTISREFPGRFSAGEGLLGIGEVFLG
jgi:hypothetical protein